MDAGRAGIIFCLVSQSWASGGGFGCPFVNLVQALDLREKINA